IRLRPILMTTAAMVTGLIPLLTASGAGAASRFSIGLVVVAGMSIGTLFTLFVLPMVYTVIATDHQAAANSKRAQEIKACGAEPSHGLAAGWGGGRDWFNHGGCPGSRRFCLDQACRVSDIRHCERSEAIQSQEGKSGLLRRLRLPAMTSAFHP